MHEGGLRPPTLVTLVGLSGSGKSSVSRRVARHLGWNLVDLDAWVEADAGCSISELFEQQGEGAFRRLEADALARALTGSQSVIATGGGAPCQPGAMDALLKTSLVVWLDASPEIIAERLSGLEDRPLLVGSRRLDTLRIQARQRVPIYSRAHLRIDVDDVDVDTVAARLLRHLEVQGA